MFGFNMDKGDAKNEFLKQLLDDLKSEDSVVRAQLNDQRLMKLAEYDVTHGYMKLKVTPDDLQSRFYEMKRLVMTGNFTLKGLEDDVYKRWGIQEDARDIAILQERENPNKQKVIAGFNFKELEVADMPEDSPENH